MHTERGNTMEKDFYDIITSGIFEKPEKENNIFFGFSILRDIPMEKYDLDQIEIRRENAKKAKSRIAEQQKKN